MAGIGFTPDGEGGLHCSLCGFSGAVVTDAVIHADWHEAYDRGVWSQGWLARGLELVAIVSVPGTGFTPTERNGVKKAMDAQTAMLMETRTEPRVRGEWCG